MQKGFTLIELMMVMSIVGILAVIAIPSYQVYIAKSRVTSLVSTAAAGLPAFSDFYTNNGRVPGSVGATVVGVDIADETKGFWNTLNHAEFHSAIDYEHTDTEAKFSVTLAGVNANVNTKKIDFIFKDIDGNMKFICLRHPGLKRHYVPNLCHGATSGGDGGG